MLELIVDQTNLYSILKRGKSVTTSFKEIEQIIGIFFKMSLVEMPSMRMYWERSTRYPAVADIISRNRFVMLLSTFHFVDYDAISEEEKNDRLWKIRPFLELFRKQCLQVTRLPDQSIDEMIIPYKGKFSKI